MLSALNIFTRKTSETDSIGNQNRDLKRKKKKWDEKVLQPQKTPEKATLEKVIREKVID